LTNSGPGEESGRFAPPRLRAALAGLCAAGDLNSRDAQLLKVTNNAVFHLPHAGVVVRITTTTALHHRVPKVIAVAGWLARQNLPAVRLRADVAQPLAAGEFLATVWDYVSPTDPPPDGRDLGHLLLQLHHVEEPPARLPPWSTVEDIKRRLTDAEGLDDADRDEIAERADQIEATLNGLGHALPPGPIHGDAHPGNLIRTPAGVALMLDFDSASHGPREWDLIPAAVDAIRFQRPQVHRDLAAVYGFDVTTWSGWPTLRAVRELQLVASAVPRLSSSTDVAAQFAHRLRTVREGLDGPPWQPYR